jgi:hypothetical protein
VGVGCRDVCDAGEVCEVCGVCEVCEMCGVCEVCEVCEVCDGPTLFPAKNSAWAYWRKRETSSACAPISAPCIPITPS